MLARDGDRKVIRVDMMLPEEPEEDELGMQGHLEVATEMERAERALAQGDVEGAMAIFKAAKEKAKQLFQKGKEAAKKAAAKGSELVKKATQPAGPQHVVVELTPAFIKSMEAHMEQQERMIGFVTELYKILVKLMSAKQAEPAAPEEEPAAETTNPPATERPCYYILRSTKA
jgi:hypothetical protein